MKWSFLPLWLTPFPRLAGMLKSRKMNVYWYCYAAIVDWHIQMGIVDRILTNFDRTAGLFHSILYTKLFAVLLFLMGGLWISRLLQNNLMDDVFNNENESFMQETRLLENEYSINLSTRFYYKGGAARLIISWREPEVEQGLDQCGQSLPCDHRSWYAR